jgi:hypothetical protein
VPIWHGHHIRRLGETLPDLLYEPKALGGRKLENFISEGALAHDWKVIAGAVRGKAGGASLWPRQVVAMIAGATDTGHREELTWSPPHSTCEV